MPRQRTRINSKITQLPEVVREELEYMLLDTSYSYNDISEWLDTKGFKISKSAVGRYALRANKATQRVVETMAKTKAIVKAVESSPDIDYTKASRIIMMDGLLQKVSTAEEEFQEMSLDSAGRLIASLSRTEIADQRAKKDYKSKMQIAFDGLEAELMSAMKGDPELKQDLAKVLKRAKERLIDNDKS